MVAWPQSNNMSVEEAVATQATVTLVDDLDGRTADERVEFTVNGVASTAAQLLNPRKEDA
jgi:hypothetical protein